MTALLENPLASLGVCNLRKTPFGQKSLFLSVKKLLGVGGGGHIMFVKTHQDGLMSGTKAWYRSEQISQGSPSRWALLTACPDLPSLVTQQESCSVAKNIRLSGTLEYYTDNRGDEGGRTR